MSRLTLPVGLIVKTCLPLLLFLIRRRGEADIFSGLKNCTKARYSFRPLKPLAADFLFGVGIDASVVHASGNTG
jgi:hypothetical protein